jgi:hypothetical protein
MQGSTKLDEYNFWTGVPPTISRFYMSGTSFNYGYITTFVPTCPSEPISLAPDKPTNVGTILGYEISATGVSAQVNSSTGEITFTAPNTVRATFSISFRYKNSCGWSSWQILSGSVRDCAAGEDPWKVPGQVDKSSSPVSSVYPNSVSDVLNIDVSPAAHANARSANTVYDIRLFNMFGSQLLQTSTNSSTVAQLNVSNLPNGIYYLHIFDGVSSTPEVHKVVVKH